MSVDDASLRRAIDPIKDRLDRLTFWARCLTGLQLLRADPGADPKAVTAAEGRLREATEALGDNPNRGEVGDGADVR